MNKNTSHLSPLTSNLNLVFMGSPEIGAIVFSDLIDLGVQFEAVITRPDKPKGRSKKPEKTPVKKVAEKHGIKTYEPQNKDELTKVIKEIQPNLCVVAAYGMIIPEEALEVPAYGMINFHPSLLPELRGPAPIPMSIMCGHAETGVSIIQVSADMDAGDILAVKKVKLKGTETTPELSENLAHLGAEMIAELIPRIEAGTVKPQKQDHNKATFSKMIKKEEGLINWHEYEAKGIEQAARAFTPWPGVYTYWNGKKLDLFDIEVIEGKFEPGLVSKRDGQILIGTKRGAIAPKFLKLEGKKKQSAKDFLCGYQEFVGTKLGDTDSSLL